MGKTKLVLREEGRKVDMMTTLSSRPQLTENKEHQMPGVEGGKQKTIGEAFSSTRRKEVWTAHAAQIRA